MTSTQIRRYAERWKPWHSYALPYIWYTGGWQPDGTDELQARCVVSGNGQTLPQLTAK